ncbi:MAG: glycosyltransferase family 9 protein [Gammaproteobacteria bacterium]
MDRILVVKLGALGDVVMATPLVDAIVGHHDGARVTLLTTPAFAPLFEAWSGLEVVALPRRGVGAMWRMLRHVRSGYERVYDLQSNDRTALLCAASGIPERVGNHPRFPYTHHPPDRWRGQSHVFDRYVEVLASAGIAVERRAPLLPAPPAARAHVRAWLERHGLVDTPPVLLHAGASPARPDKRWPYFGELAARLIAAGHAVVWLGAAPDRELNRSLAAVGGIDATDAFSILELAELGRAARCAVTNDSGPMHVLAAAGIPVFGLFGPSDWRRNHAVDQAHHVIACVEHVAAHRGRRMADCLADLDVELVHARLVEAGVVTR